MFFDLTVIQHYLTFISSSQIGIESSINGAADDDFEMQRAKSYRIATFALSELRRAISLKLSLIYIPGIGVDSYTGPQWNYDLELRC
jgi:hypothetical protein